MITDIRKQMDKVAGTAGWQPGEIRTKIFRHTYCAARLQSLDRGFPISTYTVARELGHGGESLIKRVYGHLGQVRHRSEHAEFRIEQHQDHDDIRGRLRSLRTPKTAPRPGQEAPKTDTPERWRASGASEWSGSLRHARSH
jgi:hypothetical protein